MEAINVFRGDTVEDLVQLRLENNCTGVSNNYPLEAGSVIEMRFPGETATVVLSSADNEIAIIDNALSTISYSMSTVKSLLLKVGKLQSIDIVVTQGISGIVKTSQIKKILNVADRDNV